MKPIIICAVFLFLRGCKEAKLLRYRQKTLGDKNLIGSRIETARRSRGMKQKELLAQLQVRGIDINASALSKLEGQLRTVSDIELMAFAEILELDVLWLLTGSGTPPE